MKDHFVIAFFILFVSVVSQADVVIKIRTSTDMAGVMTTQTDGSQEIKGDKSCLDASTKVTGGMAAMFSKGKPMQMVNITRLDKGIFWQLDPDKKTYMESTLDNLKQQLNETKGEGQKPEEPEYTWTVNVETIDQPQTINGFDCSGVIGKAVGVGRKNSADSMFITYEQWSAKDVPGADEVEAYQKKYSDAIGMDPMWAKENMGSILKDFGAEFVELAGKVNKSGQYPIKTIVTIEGTSKSEGEGSDENPADAMSMMNKMLGKKPDQAEGEEGGYKPFLSLTNEVESIEVKDVDDSRFEIPDGYKKK